MARYLLLVVAPMGALAGLAIAAYDWVVNELLWRHIAEQALPVRTRSAESVLF